MLCLVCWIPIRAIREQDARSVERGFRWGYLVVKTVVNFHLSDVLHDNRLCHRRLMKGNDSNSGGAYGEGWYCSCVERHRKDSCKKKKTPMAVGHHHHHHHQFHYLYH